MSKPIIAVIFGGRSVEHDVSVLTGLQFLDALDPTVYEGLPVYVAADGTWWTGKALRSRTSYPISGTEADLVPVTLACGRAGGAPALETTEKILLGSKTRRIPFDLMLPAIHGSHGEDGTLQGLLEFLDIPYGGTGTLGSAATMNKDFAKAALAARGVPVLPHALIERPASGGFIEQSVLEAILIETFGEIRLPLCVKPLQLGSSVGVSRAETLDDLVASLMAVFRIDTAAVLEPFVPNLREYNIAVSSAFGEGRLSAIERPLSDADLLDFKEKYLAGGRSGPKVEGPQSEGMASTNRVLHPEELTADQIAVIHGSALAAVQAFDLRGSVRIDYLCDSETGEIWFNEVNSVPGSFAYYLWEAAEPQVTFTDLAGAMVEEGFARHRATHADTSAASSGAAIFGRG